MVGSHQSSLFRRRQQRCEANDSVWLTHTSKKVKTDFRVRNFQFCPKLSPEDSNHDIRSEGGWVLWEYIPKFSTLLYSSENRFAPLSKVIHRILFIRNRKNVGTFKKCHKFYSIHQSIWTAIKTKKTQFQVKTSKRCYPAPTIHILHFSSSKLFKGKLRHTDC